MLRSYHAFGRWDFLNAWPRLSLVIFGVLISLAARGAAIFGFGYSVDDLVFTAFSHFDYNAIAKLAFPEGRFVLPYVLGLADALGVNLSRASILSGLALSAALAYSGALLCRLWRIKMGSAASFVVVAVFVSHPYFTDIFLWKIAMFTGGIPFMICLFALCASRQSWPMVAIASALIAFSLAWHQLPLSLSAATLSVMIAFDLLDEDRRARLREDIRPITSLLIGTLVYVAVAKFVMAVAGAPSRLHREEILVLSNPFLVLQRFAETCRMVVTADPLIAPAIRWLMLVLGMIAAISVSRLEPKRFVAAIILIASAIFAAMVCSSALLIVPRAWAPSFRLISALSVVYAAVCSMAILWSTNTARKLAISLSAIIVFAFLGKSNEIVFDQMKANMRDRATMIRIASRLESNPAFSKVTHVMFIGTSGTSLSRLNTAADISTRWGAYGTTLSPFAAFFGPTSYLVYLLNDVTGYSFSFEISPIDVADVVRNCTAERQWPAAGSVEIVESQAVICLSAASERTPGRFAVH